MAETKTYALINGITTEDVVKAIEIYLNFDKQMQVQKATTNDGYIIQGRVQQENWKTYVGMSMATTVQISKADNDINVTIGEAKWDDKIGAGAIGLFVAWPLAVTAGIGAYKQAMLPGEIFNLIAKTISIGHVSGYTTENDTVTETTAAKRFCPSCGTECDAGSRFCSNCGTKLIF